MEDHDLIKSINKEVPPDYNIERPLKDGGQGNVFVGSFQGNESAIKIFKPDTERRRVDLEIQVLTDHKCDNIVKILGATDFVLDGLPLKIIAYEYLSGGDLKKLVEQQTQTPFKQLVKIGSDVSNAIEFLWTSIQRIVHRDIKPDNIVSSSDGRFVLVDLAFARHLDLSDLTLPGYVVGTRGYMSPEQYIGRRNLTRNSDIFSLGVTLYEIATKRHPFNRDQDSLMKGELVSNLSEIRPDLPPNFISLIERMLEFRAYKRPKNIKLQFLEFLEE